MSGLHEALDERLASLPVMEYDNGYRVQALPKTELLDLLLMHPAPTQPAECGAVDRTGQRRCVFTPGHHEVENWTSHGDRGGWTWNDQPARLPKSGAELSAAGIAVHQAKRQACLDYGIGHHDCSEHTLREMTVHLTGPGAQFVTGTAMTSSAAEAKAEVVHSGTGPCGCWACSVKE